MPRWLIEAGCAPSPSRTWRRSGLRPTAHEAGRQQREMQQKYYGDTAVIAGQSPGEADMMRDVAFASRTSASENYHRRHLLPGKG